jgi:hypothetical protein
MSRKLKIVSDDADFVPAPHIPDFDTAPTRKRHAGWTAERQRKFIEHLSLTGSVGEACALVGVASSSAYRLRNKAGAEGFSRAWDAALSLAPTRLSAIAFDRAINGRAERFYKDGELVMERRIPSDHLLTWLLSRLDPLRFGSPAAKAQAAALGDSHARAASDLPLLLGSFADVPAEECEVEPIDFLDGRLGETGSGAPIGDHKEE